ncbi:MAG: T9SS type A sorting domain-containing protein, partial [Bacteroidales bacterium]|nr:T9SS type A sorting domain-containing protein [Bacteroidales bacterium]
SIQIFPNPTSECVRIVSGDKLIQRIILYSMSGEKLKTQHIDNQFADLNISDLIYGIYILEIVFDDNRLTNMKIMKY